MKQTQKPMTLEQAWTAHAADLAKLPSPPSRFRALSHWRSAIDLEAHDYADLVLQHPHKEQIVQVEVNAIMRACLCGYLAYRGWITPVAARQGAYMLGRNLRDELRTLGVQIDSLKTTLGTVMNRALDEIVQQAITQGA